MLNFNALQRHCEQFCGWALPVPNLQGDNSVTSVGTTEVVSLLPWRVVIAGRMAGREKFLVAPLFRPRDNFPYASCLSDPSNEAIACNRPAGHFPLCHSRPMPCLLPGSVPQGMTTVDYGQHLEVPFPLVPIQFCRLRTPMGKERHVVYFSPCSLLIL